MKYLISSALLFFSVNALAQDCINELLLQKPGIWADVSSSVSEVAAADLVREKKVVAALHTMITSKYSPKGIKAEFGGAFSPSQTNMTGNGYRYYIGTHNYQCVDNKIQTIFDRSVNFSISANLFDAEIYDTAQGDRLLLEGYNVMRDLPVQKDGYWYFKEIEFTIVDYTKGKSSMWLITYDGKLPYAYVSKKEFLEKRKRSLAVQMNMSASGIHDVLNNKEIEKGFKEKEYKNDPEKMQRYMKMDYLSTKERYEKLLADNEKQYKPAFDKIDVQLKMPVAELNEKAIVKMDPNDHLSYLFTDDGDPAGSILIKPNPGYFNKKLPKSSPQFFFVYLGGPYKDPIAVQFMTDIMKAVDFTTLKNMLGKEPGKAVTENNTTVQQQPANAGMFTQRAISKKIKQ